MIDLFPSAGIFKGKKCSSLWKDVDPYLRSNYFIQLVQNA